MKILDLFIQPATARTPVQKKKKMEPSSSFDISPVIHDEIIPQISQIIQQSLEVAGVFKDSDHQEEDREGC